jgi:hypothetical protein
MIGFFMTAFFGSGRRKNGSGYFVGFVLTTGFFGA